MFSFTVSTDSVGLLGNPWHMHLALNRLWGEPHAAKIGLEVVATHRAIHILNTHPHLYHHLSGFHSRTHFQIPITESIMWLANHLIHHPQQLNKLKLEPPVIPYILLHQPAYSHLAPTKMQTLVNSYPLLVVENDQSLTTAANISRKLGPKHLIIDWLHFFSEPGESTDWSKLIETLSYHSAYTFGWHISVGQRDNLPPIPLEILQTASRIARTHRIHIIIEHQFRYRKLLHNRPHLDIYTLKHLDTQYRHLLRGGLIKI